MNNSQQSPPPPVLVKTWYALLKQNDDKEAKERGKDMLMNSFGDMKSLVAYLKKHRIS